MKYSQWFLLIFMLGTFATGYTETPFITSTLPILVITTENLVVIPDEPKIQAHLGIVWHEDGGLNSSHDAFNHYDGWIGIEKRGNMSQNFPKLPYTFETRLDNGENNNVKLLGLPKENDWILRAGFIDKTLMRDALAYRLGRATGHWAPRTRHCEVILNDVYIGVYTLVESIKPDKNRLNIEKMDEDDIAGDSLTGGYIYEVSQDGPDFGQRRRYVYPSASDITNEQSDYIRDYEEEFRRVMRGSNCANPQSGYATWIDVDSFIDEILVQEAVKNSDAYGWSSYFHKDRLGKLCAGPLWDFDQALSNSTFNDGPKIDEWIIEKSEYDGWLDQNYPSFWNQLWYEPAFKHRLADRWAELRRGPFRSDIVSGIIDSLATHLADAQERNFQTWPVLGQELWRSTPGWEQRDTYQKEVDYLNVFLMDRMTWMDEQLLSAASVEPMEVSSVMAPALIVNPTPSSGINWFNYTLKQDGLVELSIYNIRGRLVKNMVQQFQQRGKYAVCWNGLDQSESVIAPGLYFSVLCQDGMILNRTKWIRF